MAHGFDDMQLDEPEVAAEAEAAGKRPSSRGRPKPGEMRVKLERSRQSARECRARKKLRYQYLEEVVRVREQANLQLRKKLDQYFQWNQELNEGHIPEQLKKMLEEEQQQQQQQQQLQQQQQQQLFSPHQPPE